MIIIMRIASLIKASALLFPPDKHILAQNEPNGIGGIEIAAMCVIVLCAVLPTQFRLHSTTYRIYLCCGCRGIWQNLMASALARVFFMINCKLLPLQYDEQKKYIVMFINEQCFCFCDRKHITHIYD